MGGCFISYLEPVDSVGMTRSGVYHGNNDAYSLHDAIIPLLYTSRYVHVRSTVCGYNTAGIIYICAALLTCAYSTHMYSVVMYILFGDHCVENHIVNLFPLCPSHGVHTCRCSLNFPLARLLMLTDGQH